MQAAGHFIAASAELAARVKFRENDLQRGHAGVFLHADRNAASVVPDQAGSVLKKFDLDLIAESGQRFVDRIVHDLIDQMVKT